MSDGSKLALGVAGAFAIAAALARRRRGSVVRFDSRRATPDRTDAGSTWEDDRPARVEIIHLYEAMTAKGAALGRQYLRSMFYLVRDFIEGWWGDYEAGLETVEPPISLAELDDLVDFGDSGEIERRLGEDGLALFADFADGQPSSGGWDERPPSTMFGEVEILRDVWLVHNTDAGSIDVEGFRLGVRDYMNLAYSGSVHPYDDSEPGFNFAYHPDDYERFGMDRGEPKYGGNVYVFWVPWAVKAWHYADEEPQVIFWGPSARRIVSLGFTDEKERDGVWEDCWFISNIGDVNGPCFPEVWQAVDWIESNWRQYQRILFGDQQRRRRRVERGWASQQVPGQQQVGPYGYKRPKRRTVYRGPKKGTPR